MCKRAACVKALDMFQLMFNCSESVLGGMAEELGMDSEIIPKIASGFGAGFSRQGETCGALSGAIMGLGLVYGRSTPDNPAKAKMYAIAGGFMKRFEEEFGTTACNELTGCVMSTDEGMDKFKAQDLHHTLCPKFVQWSVENAMALIDSK